MPVPTSQSSNSDPVRLVGFHHIFRILRFYGYNNSYSTHSPFPEPLPVGANRTGCCNRKWTHRPATVTRIAIISILGSIVLALDVYFTVRTSPDVLATDTNITNITAFSNVTSGVLPSDYTSFWISAFVIRLTSFSLYVYTGLVEKWFSEFLIDFARTVTQLLTRSYLHWPTEARHSQLRAIALDVRVGHVLACFTCAAFLFYSLGVFGATIQLHNHWSSDFYRYVYFALAFMQTLFYTIIFTFSVFVQLWYLLICRIILRLWKMPLVSSPELVLSTKAEMTNGDHHENVSRRKLFPNRKRLTDEHATRIPSATIETPKSIAYLELDEFVSYHQSICNLMRKVDDVYGRFMISSLTIELMCMIMTTKWLCSDALDGFYLIDVVLHFVYHIVVCVLKLIQAADVNEKVTSVLNVTNTYNSTATNFTKGHEQLQIYLNELIADKAQLTYGGIVLINKELIFSIAGSIVTYNITIKDLSK